jgi:hypothetical protein
MKQAVSGAYIFLVVICAIIAIARWRGGNMNETSEAETGLSKVRVSIVRWGITVSSLVICLLLILYYVNLDNLLSPDIGSKTDAYLKCRQLISDRLQSTAKFGMKPTSISAAAEHLGGGCWQLRGVVDSTEESGGTFHVDYTCILQLEEGGQWRAEQVKLIPRSLVP